MNNSSTRKLVRTAPTALAVALAPATAWGYMPDAGNYLVFFAGLIFLSILLLIFLVIASVKIQVWFERKSRQRWLRKQSQER